MPETYTELVNRVLRDHEGGDPSTYPVGDRSTARKPLDKRDLRVVLLAQENAVNVAVQAAADATTAKDAAATSAGSATGTPQFATRAAAQAATVPAFADQILVGGMLYKKDPAGTALTTGGGVKWSPAGEASVLHYPVNGLNDQPAFASAVKGGGDVHLPKRDYPVSGNLDTVSGLALRAAQGAVFKPFAPSLTGGYITNVTSDTGTRVQSGILLDNIQMDGAGQPAPYYTTVSSATTTAITLPSGASAVDGAYVGMTLQILSGAQVSQYRTITAYNGGTRVATMATAFASAPAAGDAVAIGSNENAMGFARGASDIQVNGGLVINFPSSKQVPFGQGGKTLNFEQGVYGASGRWPNSRNVFTHAFIQGKAGLIGDQSAAANRIALTLGHAENVGSFVTVMNAEAVAGISGAGGEINAVLTGGTYHNAGHAPHRIVNGNQVKSGIINLGGANGATIGDIRGWNDADYPSVSPGYPTDYPSRVGYGLTGPVGALIWGHARNTDLHDIHHTGNLDAVVKVARARALGDDAGPGGLALQMRDWNMRAIRVAGTVANVVARDDVLPTNGAEITGTWEISVDACTGNIVPPAWGPAFTNAATLHLDITEVSSGKRIIGTAAQIANTGNLFSAYPVGVTDMRSVVRRVVTLADDTAISFTPRNSFGTVNIATNSALLPGGMVNFRTGETPLASSPGSLIATRTGGMGGTTGADGAFTASAGTSLVYVENRLGGAVTLIITEL